MAVSFDHLALPAKDPDGAARFLADLLDLAVETDGAEDEFKCLRLDRGSVLFVPATAAVTPHHVAFRVAPSEFEPLLLRLRARNIAFGNDPEDATNARSLDPLGGHGRVYFVHPEGHLFEVCA